MKNLKKFVISRASIISIVSVGGILLLISSIHQSNENVVFQVVASKVSISGTGNLGQWKMETNAISSGGDFEINNHQLLSISNLSFAVPIEQLKSVNHQLESFVYNVFNQSNAHQITFKQQYGMVLPVMKKIHVIGELNILNGTHSFPMQVSYELTNNEILNIYGKQAISLSQYGIKLPSHIAGIIDDEIEIEINFALVNKSI